MLIPPVPQTRALAATVPATGFRATVIVRLPLALLIGVVLNLKEESRGSTRGFVHGLPPFVLGSGGIAEGVGTIRLAAP